MERQPQGALVSTWKDSQRLQPDFLGLEPQGSLDLSVCSCNMEGSPQSIQWVRPGAAVLPGPWTEQAQVKGSKDTRSCPLPSLSEGYEASLEDVGRQDQPSSAPLQGQASRTCGPRLPGLASLPSFSGVCPERDSVVAKNPDFRIRH